MQQSQGTFQVVGQGDDFVQATHVENFQHHGFAASQYSLAAFGTCHLGCHQQHTESSATQVIESRYIQHNRRPRGFKQRQNFALSSLGVAGIQTSLWTENTWRCAHCLKFVRNRIAYDYAQAADMTFRPTSLPRHEQPF